MSDDRASRKIPSHELTYARLRDMILFGVLPPGQAVTIQGLIEELGAGMTPVREAIRRLTAEGALEPKGNRRVTVPAMTETVLEQLAFARFTIEPELAGRALARMTPDLIARLDEIDKGVTDALSEGNLSLYLRHNHMFHFTLYEAADAPVLLDMARSLWLRAGPALRAVIGRFDGHMSRDLHREALDAMRAGDRDALQKTIALDIGQGVEQVRQALAEGMF